MRAADDRTDLTIATYRRHFDRYSERTSSEVDGELQRWLEEFAMYLPPSGRILEFGSATGRDARYLADMGHDVLCTDVIPEALRALSDQGFDTAAYDLRDSPELEWEGAFDGCFANAVLLHLSPDDFARALKTMATSLTAGGVAAFSLKAGVGDVISEEKLQAPRYFRYYSEAQIRESLSQLPLELLSLSRSDDATWLHVIARRSA